jgi:hypothetical protein
MKIDKMLFDDLYKNVLSLNHEIIVAFIIHIRYIEEKITVTILIEEMK